MKIGAVILAAGEGKRFGKLKQLIPLIGKPLFLYSLDLALHMKLNPIVLVGNEKTKEMKNHITDRSVQYVENSEYKLGMSSSLRKGIDALDEETDAVFIMLADQPLIQDEVIAEMISTYKKEYPNGCRIVRPRFQGEMGHPVLFDKELFVEIKNIKGDKGARDIIKKEKLKVVDFSHKEWNLDIDTPTDYDQAKKFFYQNISKQIGSN